MMVMGIDPGKQGAIVVLDDCGNVIAREVIPLIGGKVLDLPQIFKLLDYGSGDIHVYIEDVHAIFGSSAGATFTFGYVCGVIEGIVAARGIPYTKVQPKTWQAMLYQGIPEIRKAPVVIKKGRLAGTTKKGKLETKAMSLIAAKRLYPGVELRRTAACKVAHDGIVDALLIAGYGQRTLRRKAAD